jgi:hypothetical protein
MLSFAFATRIYIKLLVCPNVLTDNIGICAFTP